MKSNRLHLIAAVAIAAGTTSAWATEASAPTREQVRAERMEAQRNGTLIANGETGATFRDLNPARYMAQPASQGLSRADVQAAYEQARNNGELIVSTEIGLTARQLAPGNYAAPATTTGPAASGKSRAEVQAELVRARSEGHLLVQGELGLTAFELNPQAFGEADNRAAPTAANSTVTRSSLQGNPNSNLY
jgi:hypothetical protein